jgi:hypothetical protein
LIVTAALSTLVFAQSCPGDGGSGCGSCGSQQIISSQGVMSSMGPVTVVPAGTGIHINALVEDQENSELTVSFSVEDSSFVSVGLLDMTGEPLILIADGFYDPGNYRATFSTEDLEPGMYMLRVDALGGYAFARVYILS